MWRDRRGISALQDALLFCVMVSLSGALLVPAFTSTIQQEALAEKQQEEKAHEVLHQIMTCRVNEASHLNAEPLLHHFNVENKGLLKPVMDALLEREQLHRTYADLCTECVACQFRMQGVHVNILTHNFTESLQSVLSEFIGEQVGPGYDYNFTVVWRPVAGFDVGGMVCTGKTIPPHVDVFTAVAYAAMPPTVVTSETHTVAEVVRQYLQNVSGLHTTLSRYRQGDITEERCKREMIASLSSILNKTIWEGFDLNQDGDCQDTGEMRGLVDIILDYMWGKFVFITQEVYGEGVHMLTDVLALGINKRFGAIVGENIRNYLAAVVGSSDLNASVENLIEKVTEHLKEKARDFVTESGHQKIYPVVEKIVNNAENVVDLYATIIHWLFQHINPWRARLSLSLWER